MCLLDGSQYAVIMNLTIMQVTMKLDETLAAVHSTIVLCQLVK